VESIVDEARKLEDTTEVLAHADSLYPVRDMWDVNELATNVSRELRQKMERQGVTCSLNLGKDLPMAFIDYRQIAFCLRKIISDAMEAMPEDGTIVISTWTEETALVLEIRDNARVMTPSTHDTGYSSSFTDGEQAGVLPASLCK
jgi:signal transduction histidine kinase